MKFSETASYKIKFITKKNVSNGVVHEIKDNYKKILQAPERCETLRENRTSISSKCHQGIYTHAGVGVGGCRGW